MYEHGEWFSIMEESNHRDPLEIVYNRVLEIMYARLQTEVCEKARAELHQRRRLFAFVQRRRYVPITFHLSEDKILPRRLTEIFKTEGVREEIDALILQGICSAISQLDREHAKLRKLVREYERRYGTWDEDKWYLHFRTFYDPSTHEDAQEKILSYERLLHQLNKDPYSMMEELRNRVLAGLNEVALKQFNQWKNTQSEIDELKWKLEPSQQYVDESFHTRKKQRKCQQYQLITPKSAPCGHCKHPAGRLK